MSTAPETVAKTIQGEWQMLICDCGRMMNGGTYNKFDVPCGVCYHRPHLAVTVQLTPASRELLLWEHAAERLADAQA